MGFASPATVLLWVLALRPSAGTDAIMVPPVRSGDLLEVEDKACAQWQQQLVSSPTAMPEHSECNWFVGLIGIHNASALGDLGAASRRTGNHRAAVLGDGSHPFSGSTALGTTKFRTEKKGSRSAKVPVEKKIQKNQRNIGQE